MRAMLDTEQVPRLRRQQGALLRDEPSAGRTRAERRRQARAHRVSEDVLGCVKRRDLIKLGLAISTIVHGTSAPLAQAGTRNNDDRTPTGLAPSTRQPRRTALRRRLHRRRIGRRRRHASPPGSPRRASACCCSRPAAIRERSSGANPQTPAATACPTTTTCPHFTRSSTENEAMRWDFFVRHYADDERQQRDPKYRATCDGDKPSTACCIRAPARSAAAPRTTR